MVLDNQTLDPTVQHLVEWSEPMGDGFHTKVVTSEGSSPLRTYVFASLAPLEFPRRPNGQLVNWGEPLPYPEELAIGDTLPVHDSIAGDRWMVRRLIPTPPFGSALLTIWSEPYGTRTMTVQVGARLLPVGETPVPANIRRRQAPTARKTIEEMFTAWGPYLVTMDPDYIPPELRLDIDQWTPGCLVMQVQKITGGRWPAPFDVDGGTRLMTPGLIYRRPTAWGHNRFDHGRAQIFLGANPYLRHPHDPDWGKASLPFRQLLQEEREKVIAVTDRYQAFREKFANPVPASPPPVVE